MDNLLEKDKKYIWHPFSSLAGSEDPILIKSGEGVYLHTHDGRKIIDGVSSWWVNLHGHANPTIAKAVAEQALQLEHVIFAGFTHEPAIRLAENLLTIVPSNQEKFFFSDNGSTAVEVAIKMAMQHWYNQGIEKRKIVALNGAYHGDTFGAMSVGERGLFNKPFFSYLFDVDFIEFPTSSNKEIVLQEFTNLLKTKQVGVFIFEPLIQAAAGMRMYSPSLLDDLVSLAREYDVICIADEVFTGFGRTGKMFASDYLQHKPDIMCLSKGLTGGTLPLGITSCNRKILNSFTTPDFYKTFFHGHSYTGNPLACAVANASFSLLTQPECFDAIKRIERKHQQFRKNIENNSAIAEARALGTILAIELKVDSTRYDHDIRKMIYKFFLDRNILLRPLGNIIYIVPPYIIKDHELELIYKSIEEFLNILK